MTLLTWIGLLTCVGLAMGLAVHRWLAIEQKEIEKEELENNNDTKIINPINHIDWVEKKGATDG